MAQQYITLPVVENGVVILGDLWDAASSQSLGFNIFGNPKKPEMEDILRASGSADPTVSHLHHKKNSEDSANKLSIGAEVTAEMLGGILRISGGLDFELGWSNGKSSEEIERIIVEYIHRIELENAKLADYRKCMDPFTVELLKTSK